MPLLPMNDSVECYWLLRQWRTRMAKEKPGHAKLCALKLQWLGGVLFRMGYAINNHRNRAAA